MYPDLAGKTVVVTGAADGLGKHIAQGFHKAGSNVVIVARKPVSWIPKRSDRYDVLEIDVRDAARFRAWLDKCQDDEIPIDVLVNNAGSLTEGPLLDCSDESWDTMLDTNLKAVFQLSQAFARHMPSAGSRAIVNAASYAALIPSVNAGVYAASKAALVSLTRTMAAEWAPRGIRVNAYSPGVIRTRMTEPKLREHEMSMRKAISLQRLGTADEVANVVLFLASDASSYINGANIDVSGGKLVVQNPDEAWRHVEPNANDPSAG